MKKFFVFLCAMILFLGIASIAEAGPPDGYLLLEELVIPAGLPNGPYGMLSSNSLTDAQTYYIEVEGWYLSGGMSVMLNMQGGQAIRSTRIG